MVGYGDGLLGTEDTSHGVANLVGNILRLGRVLLVVEGDDIVAAVGDGDGPTGAAYQLIAGDGNGALAIGLPVGHTIDRFCVVQNTV